MIKKIKKWHLILFSGFLVMNGYFGSSKQPWQLDVCSTCGLHVHRETSSRGSTWGAVLNLTWSQRKAEPINDVKTNWSAPQLWIREMPSFWSWTEDYRIVIRDLRTSVVSAQQLPPFLSNGTGGTVWIFGQAAPSVTLNIWFPAIHRVHLDSIDTESYSKVAAIPSRFSYVEKKWSLYFEDPSLLFRTGPGPHP